MPLYKGTTEITGGKLYKGTTEIMNVYKGTTSVFQSTYSADFLVVAGGGGGANGTNSANPGGAGGAGGLRTSYGSNSGGGASAESALTLTPGTVYTITVGYGGNLPPRSSNHGTNGGPSSIVGSNITDITTVGGGGGGRYSVGAGYAGGSGGAGSNASGYGSVGGGAGTANQGFAGAGPYNGSTFISNQCGGGGAGGGGGYLYWPSSISNYNGIGGPGLVVNILNATNASAASVGEVYSGNVWYAQGGHSGGGGQNSTTGAYGGGGEPTYAGQANTGGGCGGKIPSGYSATNRRGGSGVVILRMPTASYSGTTTGSSVLTYTEGTDTIVVFKDSGTYTA